MTGQHPTPRSRVRPAPRLAPRPSGPALAPLRAVGAERCYRREDLHVVAELGTRYLSCGNLEHAVTLFEGLTVVAPDERYYWMGLGAAYDRLDRREEAVHAYQNAARLEPHDGRPEINLAQLALAMGQRSQSVKLLERGELKADRAQNLELARKARAILSTLRS